MKNTLPFLLLVVVALACNKVGPDTGSTSNSNSTNANAPAPLIAKVIDLPATIGKTKDEIKKMVNGSPKNEDPWLEYTLETCELTFMFHTKTKKASNAYFKFKPISFGDAMITGVDTPEKLGTMAGVDITGKTPKSVGALADTYEIEIGGKKLDANFYKLSGKFHQIIISAD